MNNGPLEGVRIIEFTSAWAGPYATGLLAFLGAEVVKVESLRRPDLTRCIHFITAEKLEHPDRAEVYNSLNLNKKSLQLNLSKPKAVQIARELVKVCDVVVENMRPGVMSRLGLGYEALKTDKPDLIYLSSSACGQTGPEREYVGYAPTFGALAGMCHITGYEDWPPSMMMGAVDLRSASMSAFAILTALYHHQQTGKGQYIDLSSQEVIAAFTGDVLIDCVMNQRDPIRKGNRSDTMAPHNCYRCLGEDNWISIAVSTREEWEGLCLTMGKPELIEDKRFSEPNTRKQNEAQLDLIISEWTQNIDPYQVMTMLQSAGVAAAPSMSSEALYNDPHLKEKKLFRSLEHPLLENNRVIGPPWALSETPAVIRRHAPLFGENTDELLANHLGMSSQEIQTLKDEKVIY